MFYFENAENPCVEREYWKFFVAYDVDRYFTLVYSLFVPKMHHVDIDLETWRLESMIEKLIIQAQVSK